MPNNRYTVGSGISADLESWLSEYVFTPREEGVAVQSASHGDPLVRWDNSTDAYPSQRRVTTTDERIKEHREKIQKALKLCDEIHKIIRDRLKDPVLKQLFDNHCFYAGGMFRDSFTGEEYSINDIDIFYADPTTLGTFTKLLEATTEFQINDNGNYKTRRQVHVSDDNGVLRCHASFNVGSSAGVGSPDDVIKKFDFSFNQHYYRPATSTYRFDEDTFYKKGHLTRPLADLSLHVLNLRSSNNIPEKDLKEVTDALGTLVRYFRFVSEGWDIEASKAVQLYLHVLKMTYSIGFRDGYTQNASSENSPSIDYIALMEPFKDSLDSLYDTITSSVSDAPNRSMFFNKLKTSFRRRSRMLQGIVLRSNSPNS